MLYRSVFGPSVGPIPKKVGKKGKQDGIMFYEGICGKLNAAPYVDPAAVSYESVIVQVAHGECIK